VLSAVSGLYLTGAVMAELLLDMQKVSKTFPGVQALKAVNFSIGYGEIHGLMGENGAGKSTLIKILTGVYHRDKSSGNITFDGREINPLTPLQAQELGISTIYQEVNLVPYLSVSENISLGREPRKRGFIDWNAVHKHAEEVLKDMGVNIDVRKPVNEYGTAIQQMTAIARSLSINAKLIVMDEPTSSLDGDEVKILFDVIRKLKEKQISVLFISHRIDEVFEITEKITILKDGELVGEYKTSELNKASLVSLMIGKDFDYASLTRKEGVFTGTEVLCGAKDIRQGTRLNGIDIAIRKGEVVGLAGLLGSGRTELAKILFGDTSPDTGAIEVNGKAVRFKLPKDAIKFNFAFCSEDRKAEGIMPQMSVKQNMTMAYLPSISRLGIINGGREKELVGGFIDRLKIKTYSINQRMDTLSGGNQQKVLLGKWLCMKPDFIILDEPTRGIDVGAKAEIERLIREIASEGISVLMISSEMVELIRNCDRVAVIRDGKKLGELTGSGISEENIMATIAKEHTSFS
jgi:ABC-type sugar transport system ATPase subunit